LLKLVEEAEVVFGELADVGDSPAEHSEPFDAHAPGVAGVVFGIDAAVFEHFGMDHAGAEDFKPAGVFAEAAALGVAGDAGDVHFKSGFDEGKEAGTVACFDGRLEKLSEEFVHGGEEVGEGDVLIDIEAFDLMEEDVRSAADGLVAVDGARCDDADGRLVGFHHAELGVGGVCAEEQVGVDVEGVLHVAGGMVGREVESFEVVVVGVDVGAVLDGEAHAGEHLEDLFHHAGDGVEAT